MRAPKSVRPGLLALALLLILASAVSAEAGYHITWYAMSSGGGHGGSPHYSLDGTMGQMTAGLATSPNYRLGTGYWYVMGAPQPGPTAALRWVSLPIIVKQN